MDRDEAYVQHELSFKAGIYIRGDKTLQQIFQDRYDDSIVPENECTPEEIDRFRQSLINVQNNPGCSKRFCEDLAELKHFTSEDLHKRLD